MYAVSGRRDEAQKILNRLKGLSQRTYVSSADIALVYLGLGKKDQALAWLEKAYEERDSLLTSLKEPMFDSLRSEPGFQDLLRRMGLPL